ncbi:hypothetical protein ACH5RR_034122 [Cinchona calisaya]|uniref:Protein kinase domain-containing protein n=1 Tax=Cinchona calisaya TaxID=153742 RepID=A0ABD2YC57_9GENT
MEQIRKVLPFIKLRKDNDQERLPYFYKNGSSVLKELIASFGGRYKVPIRGFTAEELIRATKNFSEPIRHTNIGDMFAGKLQDRQILVKIYTSQQQSSSWNETAPNRIIRDIAVTSQMSHLKNVLHLIGCCLEFEYPVMVYDYSPGTEFLANLLVRKNPNHDRKLLYWKNRIKIANDLQYVKSNIVTLKSDVYSFGVLMLMLLTGETDAIKYDEEMGGRTYIRDYVKGYVENDQLNQIVDPKILEEESNYKEYELEQKLLSFVDLALRCTEHERMDRPDMLEIAKELHQMEKFLSCS